MRSWFLVEGWRYFCRLFVYWICLCIIQTLWTNLNSIIFFTFKTKQHSLAVDGFFQSKKSPHFPLRGKVGKRKTVLCWSIFIFSLWGQSYENFTHYLEPDTIFCQGCQVSYLLLLLHLLDPHFFLESGSKPCWVVYHKQEFIWPTAQPTGTSSNHQTTLDTMYKRWKNLINNCIVILLRLWIWIQIEECDPEPNQNKK